MSKTITYAGVSRTAGVLKFRTASDDKRFLQLVKLGDTDVELVKINSVTSKSQAAKELLGMGFGSESAEISTLLTTVAKDDNPFKAPKARSKKSKISINVDVEPKLSIEEANARVMASMREVTPEQLLERLCFRVAKKRKSRKTVEVA